LTYGGAAGGGKTVGLLFEPLRYVCRAPNFTVVFVGAREWRWRHVGKIKFSHLQYDSTVYDWQGAQITLICFDELTQLSRHQFFDMLSRNRSTRGVPPYICATCNPDADSWGRLPGVVDRPADGVSHPRAGRCSAPLRPRCGQNRMGRTAGRLNATPLAYERSAVRL
jgi:hypothetical protein